MNVGDGVVRLKCTTSLTTGDELAKTIYNERGIALVQQGMQLTEKMIEHLLRQKIKFVYIADPHMQDIIVDQVISDELRLDAIETIKQTFTYFDQMKTMEKAYIYEYHMSELQAMIDRLLGQMVDHQDEAISLLAGLFITDDYTFQHSLNVTIYSLAIGMELHLTQKELSLLGLGALLHDLGKVFIDESILMKPGQLTSEEYDMMKSHTTKGFHFIREQTGLPSVVAHCAYQHHERLDGSGYPRALTDRAIHPYAKIIAIADVFDAVTSDRIYKEGVLPHEGLELLYAGASTKFDAQMVEAFKRSVAIYPTGMAVTLSDQRSGVVLKQNRHANDRPWIRILAHDHFRVDEPYEVDLASIIDVVITSCHI